MALGLGIGLTKARVRTLAQIIRSLFTRVSPDGHMYQAGEMTPVMGPELVVNGLSSFVAAAQATIVSSTSFTAALHGTGVTFGPLVVGKKYFVAAYGTANNTISLNTADAPTPNVRTQIAIGFGSYEFTADRPYFYIRSDVGVLSVTGLSISLKEVTGYTSTLNGFPSGNYANSTGSTVATIDQPVGLVLDAAGSVGSELVTNGSFDTDTAWTKGTGVTISGGQASFDGVTSIGSGGALLSQASTCVAGKTYRLTYRITANTTNAISLGFVSVAGEARTSAGTYEEYLTPTGSNEALRVLTRSTAGVRTGGVDNISVREVTGLHASNATTAQQPKLRRGIVNLLTWSNDLTNVSWTTQGGAVKTGNEVSLPASGAYLIRNSAAPVGLSTYAVVLSGSGTASLFAYSATDGTFGITQVTLSATPTVFVANFNSTVVSSVYFGRRIGDTATTINFHGGAVFAGTYTAQQILAYGGIPLTTTASASSALGPRYWEFDGVDDRLAFGAAIGWTDSICLVAALRLNSLSATNALLGTAAGGFAAYVLTTGVLVVDKSGTGAIRSTSAGAIAVDTTYVVTAILSGGVSTIRINGAQVATGSSALVIDGTVLNTVGAYNNGSSPFKGNIYSVLPLKGTFTDAEVSRLEAQAAKAAGGKLLNGAFVSDFA